MMKNKMKEIKTNKNKDNVSYNSGNSEMLLVKEKRHLCFKPVVLNTTL
jgi:hypothetical protein